ncbi:MAG: hypothetical protein WC314_26485 [Vulcanimicrobiota bacterium]
MSTGPSIPRDHYHSFTWTELSALSEVRSDHKLSDPPVAAPTHWIDFFTQRLTREEKIVDLQARCQPLQ